MARAALRQRGSLSIWFDPETQWLAAPNGRRGRQPVFSAAAIQTCLTLRALFGLPLRQVSGMVASLLALAGLDWPVPDYSTLCRRQKGLLVAIAHRPGTGALHLLIDSTGIKAEGCGEWCARKHGPSKPRQWRKVHLGIDAETLEIRAIEVTGAGVGDAPMLPELLEQIPVDQPVDQPSASPSASPSTSPSTSPSASPSARSVPAVPMTHGPAMRQSPRAAPLPSSRPAATADPGKRIRPVPMPATTSSAPPAALGERSGDDGAATTVEAWSKPKCIAANCSASTSAHATSTARSPSFKSEPRS